LRLSGGEVERDYQQHDQAPDDSERGPDAGECRKSRLKPAGPMQTSTPATTPRKRESILLFLARHSGESRNDELFSALLMAYR